MPFNIPIQERDTVDINPVKRTAFKSEEMADPINVKGITKTLDSYSDKIGEELKAVEKKKYSFSKYKFENERDAIINKNLNAVVSTKGENSFTAADEANKRIQYDLDKSLRSAPAEYQEEFKQLANKGINRFNDTALGHQYRQQNIMVEETEKERVKYVQDLTALNVYHEDKFNASRAELLSVVDTSMRRKYGGINGEPVSKEVQALINTKKAEVNSGAITGSIEYLVSAEDTVTASLMAQKYKSQLTAEDTIKVNALLTKGRDNYKYDLAKKEVDLVLKQYPGNPVKQRQALEKISSGEVFNAAIAMHDHHTSFTKQQKDIYEEQQMSKLQEEIRKTNGNPAAFEAIYKKAPLSKRAELAKYAVTISEGKEIIRDPEVYAKLKDMYKNNPTKFATVDLGVYRAYLPASDMTNMESLQKEVSDPLASKTTRKSVDDIVARYKRTALSELAYNTQDYKMKSAAIDSVGDDVFSIVLSSFPGRVSSDEFRKKFDAEMNIKFQTEKPLGVVDRALNALNWGDKRVPSYDSALDVAKKEYQTNKSTIIGSEYPMQFEQIKAALKARGLDSSDANTLRKLNEWKYNNNIK